MDAIDRETTSSGWIAAACVALGLAAIGFVAGLTAAAAGGSLARGLGLAAAGVLIFLAGRASMNDAGRPPA